MKRLVPIAFVAALGCADDPHTIAPGPTCDTTRCITAPPPICEGSEKVVFAAIGQCTEDPSGIGICNYPVVQRQDCTLLSDKICQGGQCVTRPPDPVIPCEGVVCNTRPASACDGNVSVIYRANGTCNPADNSCQYGIETTLDCTLAGFACRDGGCVDPTEFPCEPNPCNIPPHGTCSGNQPSVPAQLGTCTEVEVGNLTNAQCVYPVQAKPACSGATAECHLGSCARGLAAPTKAGDVIFNEIMKNPSVPGDESEWIELYNPADVAASLDGCAISDDGGETFTLTQLIVPAKGFAVIGTSADPKPNGGFVPEYRYTGMTLGNTADELTLTCAGVVIDRVQWTDLWPAGTGRSMTLGAGNTATVDGNDFLGAWCDAPNPYGDGTNLGSPMRANPACPTRQD